MNSDPNTSAPEEKFFTAPLIIIFVTVLIDLIGFGIVIPLLTYYAEEFNATPLDVGLIMGVYSLMQFVFAPVWGSLSDRFGRRPILFITILGSAVGYLVLGFATALWMIYFGRILAGITGGNLSTAQAYIADVTTRQNRARGMGLFGMAFGLGFILGPAIAGVLSQWGNHVPLLFAAGLSVANAAFLYFYLPESRKLGEPALPAKKVSKLANLRTTFKDARFATITLDYFLLVTAFSMMTTSFAYFTLVNFEFGTEKTGYLFTFVGFIAALMQGLVFGKVATRIGEAKLAVLGCAILVGTLFATPLISNQSGGLVALLIITAGLAIGNSLATPALSTLASRNASDDEQGRMLGILQSAASLARVVGPLLCGFLLTNVASTVDGGTLRRTYWVAAAIMFVSLLTSIYFLRYSKDELPS